MVAWRLEAVLSTYNLIGPEVLCALAGVLAAIAFVFSGYQDSGDSKSIVESQRIKSLTYVLGGGFLVAIPDWKLLAPTADRAHLIYIYLEFAIVSIIALLLVISVVILGQIAVRNKARPREQHIAAAPIVITFLGYGFRAYFQAYEAAEEKAAPQRLANPRAIAPIMKVMHALLVTEEDYRTSPSPAHRAVIVDRTMGAVVRCVASMLALGQGKTLQANYMTVRNIADVPSPPTTSFYQNNLDGCTHLLVMERYNDSGMSETFSLPVHADEPARLFGAPDAVARRQAVGVRVSEISFHLRPGIPKAIAKEIQEYLKQKSYKSFLSVPVFLKAEVVGVINIESDDEVFSSDMPDLNEIAQCLLPYAKVLGYLGA